MIMYAVCVRPGRRKDFCSGSNYWIGPSDCYYHGKRERYLWQTRAEASMGMESHEMIVEVNVDEGIGNDAARKNRN